MKNQSLSKKIIKAVSLSMATVVATSTVYAQDVTPDVDAVTEPANEQVNEKAQPSAAVEAAESAKDAIDDAQVADAAAEVPTENLDAAEKLVEKISGALADAEDDYNKVVEETKNANEVLDEVMDVDGDEDKENIEDTIKDAQDNIDKADQDAQEIENKAQESKDAKTSKDAKDAVNEAKTLEQEMDEALTKAETELESAQDAYDEAKAAYDEAKAAYDLMVSTKTATDADLEEAKAKMEAALADAEEKLDILDSTTLETIEAKQKLILATEDAAEKEVLAKELGEFISKYYAQKESLTEQDVAGVKVNNKDLKEVAGIPADAVVYMNADGNYVYFKSTLDENGIIKVEEVVVTVADNTVETTGVIIASGYEKADGTKLNETSNTIYIGDKANKGDILVADKSTDQVGTKTENYGANYQGTGANVQTTYELGKYDTGERTFNTAGNGAETVTDDNDYFNKVSNAKHFVESYSKAGYTIKMTTYTDFGFLGKAEWDTKTITVSDTDTPDSVWGKFVAWCKDLVCDYDITVTHTQDAVMADAIIEKTTQDYKVTTQGGGSYSDKGYSDYWTAYAWGNVAAINLINAYLNPLGFAYVEGQDTYVAADGTTYRIAKSVIPDSYTEWDFFRKTTKYKYTASYSVVKTTTENKLATTNVYKASSYKYNTGVAASEATKYTKEAYDAYEAVKAAKEAVDKIETKMAQYDKASSEYEDLGKRLDDANKALETAKGNYSDAKEKQALAKQALADAVKRLSRFGSGIVNDDDEDRIYPAPKYLDPQTNAGVIDQALIDIPAAQVPTAGPVRTASTGAVIADTAEEVVEIEDEQTPLATEEEKTVEIKDEETPLAAEKPAKRAWWWLILVALGVAGGTGYTYKKRQQKAATNVEDGKKIEK